MSLAATELLDAARAAGISVALRDDDVIDLTAPAAPPPDLVAILRAHKADLVAALRECVVTVPAAWSAGVDRLRRMPAPDGVPVDRWSQIVAEAGRFLTHWGSQAASLGWSTQDVFGVHRRRPMARYDCAGLVWFITDANVVAMTTEAAAIRQRTGGLLTFYRRKVVGDCNNIPIWELSPTASAP